MQLRYRGTAYTVSTDSLANLSIPIPAAQPTPRLAYRGHTYTVAPQPKLAPQPVAAGAATITLMYRGQTYQSQVPAVVYHAPVAVNWRWQLGS
jgi:hypothetical protein